MSKNRCQIELNILNKDPDKVGDPIYVTGNFNNWQVNDTYIGRIPSIGEKLSYTLLDIPLGELEIKFNRGTWSTLQSSLDGVLLEPIQIPVSQDSQLEIEIEAWRDQFPNSTASPQVHILDDHFYFPELNVYRRIWIYLPKSYHLSEKSFPVLYMHDAQHLFDEATSLGRSGPVEWMVDETLDESLNPCIVVAIDHPNSYEDRMNEMMVHPSKDKSIAKGWNYLEDIVYTLKPYIDKHYRTKSDAKHTGMLGSSLAGLLSIYAGLKYPTIFGLIASFSPSIWLDETNLYAVAEQLTNQKSVENSNQHYYFYIGAKEKRIDRSTNIEDMKLDLLAFADWFKEKIPNEITIDVLANGKHGAFYWQKAFKRFYDYWQSRW